ncbi:PAS domain S-box-containing protein/diguanylate cyclase (GGDEF)-like protein [Halopolyspora algeriensis]|uniref:PAS domain S-box-containing protein/diguanylate cyclase (GGDEF)-like protein n=1 Tax=Halopolyspora algeriensis TaxID=1500506 RepID=A0A368VQ96_9ACTN|nr:EAL domain-containing protein [Halopolyspora algeriensis]RCW43674.1 PAS domain S-box-containing protein/diguanylate cyclase (GGDEF)-like protein [Halopolyspora algeriensis]TQM47543.1 PAS domain S-box-containing protein/diguanylate cyclase (GGDEF)-like protein [Halopolyspora algeriensis]
MALLRRGRLSLLGRIYVLVVVLVGLLGVVAVGTLGFRQRADAATTQLTTEIHPAQRSATGLTAAYFNQARAVRGFELTGAPSSRDAYTTGRDNAVRLQDVIAREMDGYPGVLSSLAEVRRTGHAWRRQFAEPVMGAGEASALSPAEARAAQQRFDALRAELADLQNRINEIAAAEAATAEAARTAANWLTAGTVLVGLVVAAGTVLFLRTSLTRPLRTLVSQVNQVAEGHLDRPVGSVGPPELSTVAGAVETMRRRILDETRRITRIQQDLARHEAAERRRAEQDYATVVTALDEGVIVVGSVGVIESANPAAQRILGVSESEVVGSSPTSWSLFDEAGQALRPEEHPSMSAQRTGEPGNPRVVRFERADGHSVWLSVTPSVLNSQDRPPHAVVVSFTDISESRAARQRLEHEATHDPLTGLANRTLVLRRCDERSRAHPIAVLYIDLDNFKRINDSLGHGIGDDVLRIVGERLVHATFGETLVGRIGGDEFVVLSSGESAHDTLAELGERLLDSLTRPIHLQGRQLHVNGSIGISVSPAGDIRTGQDLLRDADVAMYRAKAQGSRRYAFFDVELRERMQRHMVLEQDLRHAVHRDQLWVAYQPVVDLRTDRTVVVEGLLRWAHPSHGAVSPGEFIPIAEESDLINTIGAHMLCMATRQLAAERERHALDLRLNANLSPRQLEDPQLRSVVQRALDEAGLPAHALCLEVTENAIMHEPTQAIRVLGELRELGVSLAIDDFGTGHSSLAQLRHLPLDTLKIDRSFITDLGESRDLEAIVTGILTMAHAVGLGVVAEGVETAHQLELLRHLGCDYAQGYYLSKPVPIDELLTSQHGSNPRP